MKRSLRSEAALLSGRREADSSVSFARLCLWWMLSVHHSACFVLNAAQEGGVVRRLHTVLMSGGVKCEQEGD